MSGRMKDQNIGERVSENRTKKVFLKIKDSICRKCGAKFPVQVVVMCRECGSLLVERIYEEMEVPERLRGKPKDRKLPHCFGRFSEDELGRHSVECDYCGEYFRCIAESSPKGEGSR